MFNVIPCTLMYSHGVHWDVYLTGCGLSLLIAFVLGGVMLLPDE